MRCRVHRVNTHRVVCELTQGARKFFAYGGEPRAYDEGAIVRVMHAASPNLVPAVLAHDAARGWWVAPAVQGKPLSERPPANGPRAVGHVIGRLQAVSMPHLDALCAAGLPRLSPGHLCEALARVLSRDSASYRQARARIEGLPWDDRPCLVYLDPHPGNFIQNHLGAITVIDWERCAVGPFELGHALLAHYIGASSPWFDAREMREGFLAGAGLASSVNGTAGKPIDDVDAQLVELAIAAAIGLVHLAGSDLIGTRALMQRTLATRLERCVAAVPHGQAELLTESL